MKETKHRAILETALLLKEGASKSEILLNYKLGPHIEKAEKILVILQ